MILRWQTQRIVTGFQFSKTTKLTKDTGLATKAMDYVREPVLMHNVLDLLEQLPVPHVFTVRLVPDAVNHCGGRVGTHKTFGSFFFYTDQIICKKTTNGKTRSHSVWKTGVFGNVD